MAPAEKKAPQGKTGGGATGVKKARKPRKNTGRRFYPTEDVARPRKNPKIKPFSKHTRSLRKSITPGTVLILLAGIHKGKRVVFLKQLETGLLLVTGPFFANQCPMRRINQNYVIATKTKLDISSVKIPENLNDKYFRKIQKRKAKPSEGDIFESKKEVYQVSEQRKADQKLVDKQIMEALRKHPEKKMMMGYLSTMFSLSNGQYPHNMIF